MKREGMDGGHQGEGSSGGLLHSDPRNGYAFAVETAAQVVSSPHEHPGYLVKGLMPSSGMHVLYGPPGVGKSFLALDVALHVAAGREWAGRKVDVRGGCVVYVASEGSGAFRTRIACALRERGIPATIPFVLVTKAPNLGLATQRDSDAFVSDVRDQCRKLGLKPRLIVLDTLARSIVGMDESSAKDMGIFVDNAAKLSKAFGDALVMPVHHTGKEAERGMRGSSALQGAADAMWQLRQEEEGLSFLVEKMKDGRSGFRMKFSLREVGCGRDRDGDEVTTQVVEFPDQPFESPGRTAGKSAGKDDPARTRSAVLRVVRMILASDGVASAPDMPAEAGRRKAMRSRDLAKAGVEALVKGGSYPKRETARTTFDTQRKALVAAGKMTERDGWTWSDQDGEPFDDMTF